MSSEGLDKTIITDNWQIFSKKLFQHFIYHKNFNLKLFAVQEFSTKIYLCGTLYPSLRPAPCLLVLIGLKNGVVLPPLITQDCWLLSSNLNQLIKLLPKANLFNTVIRKSWSKESKAFSISMLTKYHLPPTQIYYLSLGKNRIMENSGFKHF